MGRRQNNNGRQLTVDWKSNQTGVHLDSEMLVGCGMRGTNVKLEWLWTRTSRHIALLGCFLLATTACATDLGSKAETATLEENTTSLDRATTDLSPQIGTEIATFALG